MWFTETPWPPLLILATIGVICAIGWKAQQRNAFLIGIILVTLAGAIVLVVESVIVTDKERVEASVRDLVWAFQTESWLYDGASPFPGEDRIKTFSFISSRAHDLRMVVWKALQLVRVQDDLRVTDVRSTLKSQGSRATTHFRANATVMVGHQDAVGREPTRWELTWQRESGIWKVIRVQRLNVISGEPIRDMFAWED